MNRQIVVCVLTLLTASTVNASDKVAGWIKNFDMKSKLEGLQSNFAFVRTGCVDSYGLVRSTVVNSTVLGKCPESLQGFVKDNFGLLTIITGSALVGWSTWEWSKRRYASKYRNGTDDYRIQETQKVVPKVSRELRAIATNPRAIALLNRRGTECVEFEVKSSTFGSVVSKGVVSNDKGNLLVSFTNCLVPGSAVYNFPKNQTDISAALGALGENLNNKPDLALSAARTIACNSNVDFDIAEDSNSLMFTSNWWGPAVDNFILRGSLHTIFKEGNKSNLEEIKQEIASLSTSLIGLSLTGNDKKITICLSDKISGLDFKFGLLEAGTLSALERLKKFWGSDSNEPNTLQRVMRDYMVHAPFATDKERDVRFTIVYEINVSAGNKGVVIAADKIKSGRALVVDGGDNNANNGKLVWPLLANEPLTGCALGNVLGIFLHTDSICKNFSGARNYMVGTDGKPAHAAVGLKIEKLATNIGGNPLTDAVDNRVITIIVNGVQTKYTLTAQKGLFVAEQLANETLRAQIIDAITFAHEKHSEGATISNEFELRLHEENDKVYYQILNEQGVLCRQSPFFSIASASNAGQASQPSSLGESNGHDDGTKYDRQTISEELDKMDDNLINLLGDMVGKDVLADEIKNEIDARNNVLHAGQSSQPSSSDSGASSSTDVEQPKRLSRGALLAWLAEQPQYERSMSPEVKQHDMLELRRANSMNDMNDLNLPIDYDFRDFESSEDGEGDSEEAE